MFLRRVTRQSFGLVEKFVLFSEIFFPLAVTESELFTPAL